VVRVNSGQYPDVPRFCHGHNARVAHPSQLPGGGRAAWAAAEAGKHFCACGCNEPVEVVPWYHSEGIPKYINHHIGRPRKTEADARESLRVRFLALVTPGDEGECWPWLGRYAPNARGVIAFHLNGKSHRHNAARVSYMVFVGPLSDDLQVDHVCRNRACVNPWHLDAVTRKENNRRRLSAEEHRALAPRRPS